MNQTFYKLLALGSVFSLSACNHANQNNSTTLKVTNTYTLQSCDRETRAYFVEMQGHDKHYTGFIQTGNEHRILETEKKFKIGSHTAIDLAKAHFDGFFNTYE